MTEKEQSAIPAWHTDTGGVQSNVKESANINLTLLPSSDGTEFEAQWWKEGQDAPFWRIWIRPSQVPAMAADFLAFVKIPERLRGSVNLRMKRINRYDGRVLRDK